MQKFKFHFEFIIFIFLKTFLKVGQERKCQSQFKNNFRTTLGVRVWVKVLCGCKVDRRSCKNSLSRPLFLVKQWGYWYGLKTYYLEVTPAAKSRGTAHLYLQQSCRRSKHIIAEILILGKIISHTYNIHYFSPP